MVCSNNRKQSSITTNKTQSLWGDRSMRIGAPKGRSVSPVGRIGGKNASLHGLADIGYCTTAYRDSART